MGVAETILFTLDAAGKADLGRTAIQKLVYFIKLNTSLDVQFRPYYYGPYSDKVTDSIQTLKALNFIEENPEPFQSRDDPSLLVMKYGYKLTKDGESVVKTLKDKNPKQYDEINTIVQQCRRISGLDTNTLAYAAKVKFILSMEGVELNETIIRDSAKKYGWNLTEENVNKAVQLLNGLGLLVS